MSCVPSSHMFAHSPLAVLAVVLGPSAASARPRSWSATSDESSAGDPALCPIAYGCPVVWSSKVTSVQFSEFNGPAGFAWGRPVVAHPRLAENHADVSSAAAEFSAAGTAVMDFLGLSYVASEVGVAFPDIITLQVDNTACQAFASSRRFWQALLRG